MTLLGVMDNDVYIVRSLYRYRQASVEAQNLFNDAGRNSRARGGGGGGGGGGGNQHRGGGGVIVPENRQQAIDFEEDSDWYGYQIFIYD